MQTLPDREAHLSCAIRTPYRTRFRPSAFVRPEDTTGPLQVPTTLSWAHPTSRLALSSLPLSLRAGSDPTPVRSPVVTLSFQTKRRPRPAGSGVREEVLGGLGPLQLFRAPPSGLSAHPELPLLPVLYREHCGERGKIPARRSPQARDGYTAPGCRRSTPRRAAAGPGPGPTTPTSSRPSETRRRRTIAGGPTSAVA